MKRKILEKLIKWKEDKNRKPLIVNGARQVGKTHSIMEFAKQYYKNVIYINFEINNRARQIFEESIEPSYIIESLSFIYKEQISKEDTLIFFDEIQMCERALTSLKYFCENEREYNVISAGSLLGVAVNRKKYSFPVGKVETITMYPLDFEEFLWANDRVELSKEIKVAFDEDKKLDKIKHEMALELYDKYIILGGMPAVINEYLEKKDIILAEQIQNEIMNNYIADMVKYTENSESVKVRAAYNSIPLQLAKENKKFQYKTIQNGGSSIIFGESIEWLLQAGNIIKCNKLNNIDMPLYVYQDLSNFKIYMSDVGLLVLRSNLSYELITRRDSLNNIFLGAIVENYIAQTLRANEYELYYWKSKSIAEVDFVIQKGSDIIPIEVKAGNNIKSKSLSVYIEMYKPKYSIRISRKNFGFENNIKSIPLYAAHLI